MNFVLNFDNLLLIPTSLTIIFFFLLGPNIYFQNPKNLSNKFFFIYLILGGIWGILNYFLFTVPNPLLFLIILRTIMSLAIFINFFAYLVISTYPEGKLNISKTNIILLSFLALLMGILALTNFLFPAIKAFDSTRDTETNFLGVLSFILTVSLFNILSFIDIIKKIINNPQKRKEYFVLFFAFFFTLFLIIFFNFILPNFLKITKYVKFASLYLLPFIISISIGILRFKLFNFKVISAYIFVMLLLLFITFELVQSKSLSEIIFRIFLLFGLIIVGIFLTRNVYLEITYREKLEQLNRIKSEFLSFASHQVKAPMAVAKGYAELIMEGIENVPEQAKDFAKKIKEVIDNLLFLVEEFMDYRRIEEGRMEYNLEKVELISFTKEIFDKFNLTAQEKGLEYKFDTKIEKAFAQIDKVKFAQVIQNLIDNALKYTKQGFVKLDIWREEKNLIICVIDSGIGMSKELQNRLFGEFIRDPSIKKEIRGTGLGLYIAKNIVEAHQGKIWAESEGEGEGSKFYVKIPAYFEN